MLKKLFRGLFKAISRIFQGPSPRELPDLEIPVEFEAPESPPPLEPEREEPEEEPETEFFNFGKEERGTVPPEFVEVIARAKYSSGKGGVGAEVHFFLERDHAYTASQLQNIFQKWVATGETPKDVDISIINWQTTSVDERGRVLRHNSDEHSGQAEHSINRGMRSALRKARVYF